MSLNRIGSLVAYALISDADLSVPLYPRQRYDEVIGCSHDRVKVEKYLVWKLLEKVATDCLNLDFANLQFTKTSNGQWICPDFHFSLSHTDGLVCVAVSHSAIGVDAEAVRKIRDAISGKILTANELSVKERLVGEEGNAYLLESWVRKESIFKKSDGTAMMPTKIEASEHPTALRRISVNGREYIISVCCDDADKTEFKYMEEI